MLYSFGMIGYEDIYKNILQYLFENNSYLTNMFQYSNWWFCLFNTKNVQKSCSPLYSSWNISCERGARDIHMELVVPDETSKYKVETDSDTVLIRDEGEHRFSINIPELKKGESVHLKVKGTV